MKKISIISIITSVLIAGCSPASSSLGNEGDVKIVKKTEDNSKETKEKVFREYIKLFPNDEYACGITKENKAECWGVEKYGRTIVPEDLGEVIDLSLDTKFVCAIKMDNTVKCWGDDSENQLEVFHQNQPYFSNEDKIDNVKKIMSSNDFSIALTKNNELKYWGYYNYGRTHIPKDALKAKDFQLMDNQVCAIKMDDTVKCWGDNTYEDLTPPTDLKDVASIEIFKEFENNHSVCAIKKDGNPICWGNENIKEIPEDIGEIISFQKISPEKICAIKVDNTAECWGNSLGINNIPDDLGKVKKIVGIDTDACAIKMDDTVECWGDNNNGRFIPPRDINKIKDLATTKSNVCAITEENELMCWGKYARNFKPKYDGKIKKFIPTKNDEFCAMKNNNELMCWKTDEQVTPYYGKY